MGVEEVRREGWGLREAEKRGRDTEKRIGPGKEKREKTGYWREWEEERGRILKRVKRAAAKK